MAKIFFTVLVLLFSLTTQSMACEGKKARCVTPKPTKNYLTDKHMKMISLKGLQITNVDTGEELLLGNENLSKIERVSEDLKEMLIRETNTTPISSVYEAGAVDSNNMYVFAGKTKSESADYIYSLNVILVYNDGSTFALSMGIKAATVGLLTMDAGEEEVSQTAEATIKNGTFWPY